MASETTPIVTGKTAPSTIAMMSSEDSSLILFPCPCIARKKMGYQAAMVYFEDILNNDKNEKITKVIESELIKRKSSTR